MHGERHRPRHTSTVYTTVWIKTMENHEEPRRTMACKRLQCIPFYWIIWVSSLRRIEMAGKAGCSSPQVGTVWPMLQWRLFSALRFCPTWFQGKVLEMLTGTGSNFIYPTCVWRPWICVVWPWWIWECHDGMRLEFQSRWSQHFHLDVYSTSNAIPVVSSTSFWGFKPICTCAPLARSMWVGGWSHCYKKRMQPNLTDFRDDYLGVIRLPLLIRSVLHLLLTSVSVTLFKSHHSAGRRSDILPASRVRATTIHVLGSVSLFASLPKTLGLPKSFSWNILRYFQGVPSNTTTL